MLERMREVLIHSKVYRTSSPWSHDHSDRCQENYVNLEYKKLSLIIEASILPLSLEMVAFSILAIVFAMKRNWQSLWILANVITINALSADPDCALNLPESLILH